MAYISADRTREIKKELTKKFPNLKFSVRREHYTSVWVAITKGDVDFSDIMKDRSDGYVQINRFWIDDFYPTHAKLLKEILEIVNKGNYDNSDIMTDYHEVGFYITLAIGKWDKPYELVR